MSKYKNKVTLLFTSIVGLAVYIFLTDYDFHKQTSNWLRYSTEFSRRKLPAQSFDRFETPKGNLTLVTAYFDIGKLPFKGFDKEQYKLWARAYRYVASPLVVYTDSDDFFTSITNVREYFPQITVVLKIDKNTLWPFHSIDKIKEVFSQPGYPQIPPNTVMPDYTAVQHAKYALVAHTIKSNYLPNKFYAWIDIGYFREIINNKLYFELLPPRNLITTKVAFNLINAKQPKITPFKIFRENQIWVGGGMFVGEANVLLQFENLYQRAFIYFLHNKLMNSDQQLLYALYSEEGRNNLKPEIEIQPYKPSNFKGNIWFYLGYYCRHFMPNPS